MKKIKFNSKQEEKTYYEQVASEAEFLDWYKKQDLPTYEQPSVTTDMTDRKSVV